ncbi:hypothetical protein GKZ28_05985 [Clostridium chromiireducens]|uniref:Uncharacterized protein n=1 Tax=Clostridium chromiireducens TaxID=225345 RepID=A0A964W1G5_9CLOT|nr:hypothetical protein [Clostridium chromiireducens]MVX63249.1 hypothetical protein [Clostridium chromiireducens]
MKNHKFRNLFWVILTSIILIIIVLIKFSGSYIGSKSNTNDQSQSSNYSLEDYKDLYGTWSIEKHITSNMKTSLNESIINLCIGQKFTIEEAKISSIYGTINEPTIEQGTITSQDFYKHYDDTFENLHIPGDKVKYFRITKPEETSHSATILIADNNTVYVLLGGSLFQLKKL